MPLTYGMSCALAMHRMLPNPNCLMPSAPVSKRLSSIHPAMTVGIMETSLTQAIEPSSNGRNGGGACRKSIAMEINRSQRANGFGGNSILP